MDINTEAPFQSARDGVADPAGKAAAALLLGVAGFQAALALAAPWGSAAYGGGNPGVLPHSLRTASAGACGVYLLLAAAAGTSFVPAALRRRVLYGTAGLMVVGTLMNLASPSLIERMIWTPVTAALVVLLWRSAKGEVIASEPAFWHRSSSRKSPQR
ncbi:hypothetical protein [Pseudarthrobacter sp. MM222]|uniref:hypothetical protein n=1 Tax=Pseudarthrobacter sp. MM222 TaxID=3018929 RepID=UPI00221F15AC|nr:hypothetical protein [Pseudarthrobacter sp. MM222]CAI3793630.1 hypothetical protein NKCBBBOE_00856 [Pseudarthrobacter sp. MM222]